MDVCGAFMGQKGTLRIIVEVSEDASNCQAVHQTECFQLGRANIQDRLSLWKGNLGAI
jgi:hypothetical protein